MVMWVATAGDIASAAAALSGLLLVFIGAVVTGYSSYDATLQGAVRSRFQRRALLAVTGFMFALFAVPLALSGKLWAVPCVVIAAVALLSVSLVLTAATALATISDLWAN